MTFDEETGGDAARGRARTAYASADMRIRRERILDAVRALIGARGQANFTMRDLARESGVAISTLYEVHGGKEALVAAALCDHYAERLKTLAPPAGDDAVADHIHHQIAMIEATFDFRHQSIAAILLYFSATPKLMIRDRLRAISNTHNAALLARIAAAGDLRGWADIATIAYQMTQANFALLHDWAIGRMSDPDLRAHGPLAQLVLLASVSSGAAALSVERLIADYRIAAAPV